MALGVVAVDVPVSDVAATTPPPADGDDDAEPPLPLLPLDGDATSVVPDMPFLLLFVLRFGDGVNGVVVLRLGFLLNIVDCNVAVVAVLWLIDGRG